MPFSEEKKNPNIGSHNPHDSSNSKKSRWSHTTLFFLVLNYVYDARQPNLCSISNKDMHASQNNRTTLIFFLLEHTWYKSNVLGDVNLISKWTFLWGLSCLGTRKRRNFLLETKMEEKIASKKVCDDDEILSSAPRRLYPRTLYLNNIYSSTLYIILFYICTKYMYKFVYMRYSLCRKTHIDVFNFLFVFWINFIFLLQIV
jgi:hypothetical protein